MEIKLGGDRLGCKVFLYEHFEEEDLLLAKWWHLLVESGEIENVFVRKGRSLGGFFGSFKDVALVYAVDDTFDIWWAGWFSQLHGCFEVGMWCRKDCRGMLRHLLITEQFYNSLFSKVQTVVGITKQEHLLKLHEKLGYKWMPAPGLWDGEMGWIMVMTREGYEAGMLKKLVLRMETLGMRRGRGRKGE